MLIRDSSSMRWMRNPSARTCARWSSGSEDRRVDVRYRSIAASVQTRNPRARNSVFAPPSSRPKRAARSISVSRPASSRSVTAACNRRWAISSRRIVGQGIAARLLLVQSGIAGVARPPGIRFGSHAKRLVSSQRVLQARDVGAEQRDRLLGVLEVEQAVPEAEIEQAGLPSSEAIGGALLIAWGARRLRSIQASTTASGAARSSQRDAASPPGLMPSSADSPTSSVSDSGRMPILRAAFTSTAK